MVGIPQCAGPLRRHLRLRSAPESSTTHLRTTSVAGIPTSPQHRTPWLSGRSPPKVSLFYTRLILSGASRQHISLTQRYEANPSPACDDTDGLKRVLRDCTLCNLVPLSPAK